jgi:(p)ppGpp synthase/HD superfamily hydrolase
MQLDPLRWAKFYAAVKHGDQTYAGSLPYTHHLSQVEAVMRRFGITAVADPAYDAHLWLEDPRAETDARLLECAWLHDVIEDTGTKRKDIEEMFGTFVADLVDAVSNPPKDVAANRAARHAMVYPKIRKTRDAIVVKLSDRIANVEMGGSLVQMYRKEYENFRINLKGHCAVSKTYEQIVDDMWNRLDEMLK